MKLEEAIEGLRYLISDDCTDSHFDHVDEIEMAIESLEKQTPKKPTYYVYGYADGKLVYNTWHCPNCKKGYEVDFDNYNYCPYCGQRIDRSEVKEWNSH